MNNRKYWISSLDVGNHSLLHWLCTVLSVRGKLKLWHKLHLCWRHWIAKRKFSFALSQICKSKKYFYVEFWTFFDVHLPQCITPYLNFMYKLSTFNVLKFSSHLTLGRKVVRWSAYLVWIHFLYCSSVFSYVISFLFWESRINKTEQDLMLPVAYNEFVDDLCVSWNQLIK